MQTRHNENSVALKAQAERFETDFGRIIDNLAEWGGFDDALLVAIVLVESSGNSKARNKKSGAQGFGQLKPIAKREAGCAKVLKPEENLACMTNYLAVLRDKEGFTSKHEMLLAYNLGPSKAREALSNDPWIAVTHFFVIRVLGTETLISES